MDILLIDEQIKNSLNSIDKSYYFLECLNIIDRYKKLLSKPILRSDEIRGTTKDKSNVIKEYLKIISKYYKPRIDYEKLLYYDYVYEHLTRKCENCIGTNFIVHKGLITCDDCAVVYGPVFIDAFRTGVIVRKTNKYKFKKRIEI